VNQAAAMQATSVQCATRTRASHTRTNQPLWFLAPVGTGASVRGWK